MQLKVGKSVSDPLGGYAYPAVMPGRIVENELIENAQTGSNGLQQCRQVTYGNCEAVNELEAVIHLTHLIRI